MGFFKRAAEGLAGGVVICGTVVGVAILAAVGAKIGGKMGNEIVDVMFPEDVAAPDDEVVLVEE